ncbi:DNA mismatch repair protein MutS [Prevotella disiens]|jgi:DNA mismatch repair protein mutS|uniref:DNA mismatch repair protein MutS n=1 Tax=Prevotella disiens TaxID=28130 RepID=UPI00216B5CB1|nr:DNA mismatch repair protein MutS [Prevotella disiens]
MEGKVKPLVEQEKAVRRDSESLSDKKTAKKSEVFYSSVAYLQAGEDIKDISAMHKRGHLNKLLTTVASYDRGEAINLNSTFKSPLQNKGDELLRENKNYAVVYNSVVGGTYEVFRKVQAQEVKMNIERYGLSENSTNDVKQLYKANESQTQKQSDSSSLSPIMKRYTSMKEQHPDALLLFRCGDFYETYKEDAVKASNILGITLTKHSKRMDEEGKPLKMAGFPYYALDTYLPKLIRAGERVGICEQLEMPRKEKVKQTKSTKADIDTKEVRDNLVNRIVETVGKNNHHAFVLPLSDKALNVETNKGENAELAKMQVLRGRVTFIDSEDNKLQLRDLKVNTILQLTETLPSIAKTYVEEIKSKETISQPTNQPVSAQSATTEQQQFIDDIKAAMGSSKMVVLPEFGTRKGVVAGTDEDKGISLNRVYAWNDNVSFAGSVPGDDANKRRYYHPENIRPEFYDYLISEVRRAVAPQLITENGQKVTSANMFESPKQEGKYFFYARLDGVGLHPKAVKEADVEAFMKNEISVKEMFSKYYPTKMAKQLDKEDFDSLKLSDGNELTKFRVYKQRNEEKSHFGEYLLYAEMGNKRFHVTPLSHDQLDAYFDRTQSKGQIAEKVIGEQLHLKSAYEKYKLSENIPVQEVRVRKVPEGDWLISASLGNKGQTPEHKVSNNDLYSLFKSKTATREQLAAKYLTEDIKELSRSKPLERSQGLKR